MSFILDTRPATEPVPVECNAAAGASSKTAADLVCTGYADVMLADRTSAQYTPAEFSLPFQEQTAEVIRQAVILAAVLGTVSLVAWTIERTPVRAYNILALQQFHL